jgi:diguanylate cyclase (GGDEF)-like protein/PAS domain S-box-containing protein
MTHALTSQRPSRHAWLDTGWAPLAVALGYFGAAQLAIHTTLMLEGIVFFWPANAVLLCALLRCPGRRWPGLLLAAIAAECAADLGSFTLGQALLFGAINAGEAAFAALWLTRGLTRRHSFERLEQVIDFGVGAVGAACALAAVAGALVYRHVIQGGETLVTYWQIWWLSDAMGLLLITPLLLAWFDGAPWTRLRQQQREVVLVLLLGAAASLGVFAYGSINEPVSPAGPMLLFPLVIWAASRLGTRSVATFGLVVALVAIECTRRGMGPFADVQAPQAVLQLQAFVLSLSVSALAICAVVSQLRQRNAELVLRDRAMESMDDGVVIADARLPDMPITYVNPSFERLTGYRADEVLGRNCRFLQGPDRDQPARAEMRHAIQHGEPVQVLLRNHRKDGTLFWNELTLTPVRDEQRQLYAYVGIQRDVTALHAAGAELQQAHGELRQANQALERRVAERTQALEQANLQLADLAHTDALTGLWNRRYFVDAAQRRIDAQRRHGRPMCLLMIDADHFKRVNDQHGHSVGDAVLRGLSVCLLGELRAGDLLARLGGEEFVALLGDTALPEALQVAERWRAAVAALRVPHGAATIGLTISIGVATWAAGGDLDSWLSEADERLYAAKAAGRDRVSA